MASIHKHSSGRSPFWFAAWRDADGRLRLKSTKQKERTKAFLIAAEFERAQKQGHAGTLTEVHCRKVLSEILERVTEGQESVRSISVRDYFRDWIESKEGTSSKGTADRYGHTTSLFIEFLGLKAKKPLSAITAADIQRFATYRGNMKIASRTLVVDIKTLNVAFNRARRQQLISTNPVEAVELPRGESHTREVFTSAQVKMLRDVAPAGEWPTLITIAYFTGARLTDAAQMLWENVNLTERIITYRQKKTGQPITVPMHPALEDHLLQLASIDAPSDFLCPTLATKRTGGAHGLSRGFANIMKSAGVDAKIVDGMGARRFSKLSFHALRHSFNSELHSRA